MAAVRTAFVVSLVPCLALIGCFVSFEDYPVGALGSSDAGASPTGGSGADMGGAGGGSALDSTLLIDDFEDGNSQVSLVAGRDGYWFTSNDGTGQQSPDSHADTLPKLLNPARGASTRALHALHCSWAKAETFDVWIDDVSFY